MTSPLRHLHHICLVVHDIDAATACPVSTPLSPQTPRIPFARWIRLPRWKRATIVNQIHHERRIHRDNFRIVEHVSE